MPAGAVRRARSASALGDGVGTDDLLERSLVVGGGVLGRRAGDDRLDGLLQGHRHLRVLGEGRAGSGCTATTSSAMNDSIGSSVSTSALTSSRLVIRGCPPRPAVTCSAEFMNVSSAHASAGCSVFGFIVHTPPPDIDAKSSPPSAPPGLVGGDHRPADDLVAVLHREQRLLGIGMDRPSARSSRPR